MKNKENLQSLNLLLDKLGSLNPLPDLVLVADGGIGHECFVQPALEVGVP